MSTIASQPVVDHLKQDPILNGQNFVVVSFVNPKDKLVEKNLYYANNFMVNDINKMITAQAIQMVKKLSVEMNKKISDTLDRLKNSVDEEDKHIYRILNEKYRSMSLDEDEYVEECRRQYELDSEEILDRYKMYLSENRVKLDHTFDEANNDANSLRGFKVRGAFSRFEDARDRAQFLRDNVEQGIHAFVVQMGVWFPVDMEADEVQDQEYMLPKLNELMGKYHEGMQARDQFYQERKKEMMENPAQVSGGKMSVKERLQKKLQEKQSKKVNDELAEFKALHQGQGQGGGAAPDS
jgi:hypothetical protein